MLSRAPLRRSCSDKWYRPRTSRTECADSFATLLVFCDSEAAGLALFQGSWLGALHCSRTEVRMTLRWREMDSNFQYAGAVNLVVGLLGGLCFAIGCGPGEALSGTTR